MKNTKVTAQEILDCLNKEYSLADINELYKALIAYDYGLEEISKENEDTLNGIIDFYYENPRISGFINDEIREMAMEQLED